MASSNPIWSDDLLNRWLPEQPEYRELVDDPAPLHQFRDTAVGLLAAYVDGPAPNEAVTREEVILPLLRALGWEHTLTEQPLLEGGTPDRMLFADAESRQRGALSDNPIEHAIGLTECKAWLRSFDARGSDPRRGTPADQVRGYLLRAHPDSRGGVRWAMLTNGAAWRIYSHEARPRTRYWEVNLLEILQVSQQGTLFAQNNAAENLHALRVAYLVLRRDSWILAGAQRESFLDRLLAEGRHAEASLSDDLSTVVFKDVYPQLVRDLWNAEPGASADEIAQAAQTFLYRLLFIFYAEDREMLPVERDPYRDNSARYSLRRHINERYNRVPISATFTNYWDNIQQLSGMVDGGNEEIGIPEYNGGLFAEYRHPLLGRVKLNNRQVANIIQPLSYRGPDYINYRDLSIRQLGGIYERLLELVPVRSDDGAVSTALQPYARKDSGSYYTPQELVDLIVEQTLGPLADEREQAFRDNPSPENDPAIAITRLRVLDPAMGSGHFLLTAIDWLTERLEDLVDREWPEAKGYVSPLREQLWELQEEHPDLSDYALLQRMVLKRCIYGVDKNPMAVELAKVALWLHSFSGALPLPFLDHRLLTGDSLLGIRADAAADFFTQYAPERFGNHFPADLENLRSLEQNAAPALSEPLDLLVDEVHAAGAKRDELRPSFQRIRRAFNLVAGMRMLGVGMTKRERDEFFEPVRETFHRGPRRAIAILYNGENQADRTPTTPEYRQIRDDAFDFAERDRILHWEIEFPQVMANGGFDAVIGNPPWDKIKLQEVEWWATRDLDVARAPTAAARKALVAERRALDDPLVAEFDEAAEQATQLSTLIRKAGDYPLLGKGDINLYSLFVERSLLLLKSDGVCGLLTPSGIYADKTAADYFRSISTTGRLGGIYDFENRRSANRSAKTAKWFDDVHPQFRFCATITGGTSRVFAKAICGFLLNGQADLDDRDRVFPLSPEDFSTINPNTGTAPILRNRIDAELLTRIYREHKVLVDRSTGNEQKLYPVRYHRMFDMANDSDLFIATKDLQASGAYMVARNRYKKGDQEWMPLYQGRMIDTFDHRANNIGLNPNNTMRPYTSSRVSDTMHADPKFFPAVPNWVEAQEIDNVLVQEVTWFISFRDVTSATNERTMIAAISPRSAYAHKAPLLLPDARLSGIDAATLLANLNSLCFDYCAKRKLPGVSLTWYVVEQLPMIHPDDFDRPFGDTTARELVRDHVLRLTYTAYDLTPFARDLGYDGDPFTWDPAERRQLRARLDALFFHLYGLSEDDADYILDQFPVLEKNERKEFGHYLTKHLVLSHYKALDAGDTTAEISEQASG